MPWCRTVARVRKESMETPLAEQSPSRDGYRETALRAARPNDAPHADDPLDHGHDDDDEADLHGGGGGDDKLAALELKITENFDRQRGQTRSRQEQRGVELAE